MFQIFLGQFIAGFKTWARYLIHVPNKVEPYPMDTINKIEIETGVIN